MKNLFPVKKVYTSDLTNFLEPPLKLVKKIADARVKAKRDIKRQAKMMEESEKVVRDAYQSRQIMNEDEGLNASLKNYSDKKKQELKYFVEYYTYRKANMMNLGDDIEIEESEDKNQMDPEDFDKIFTLVSEIDKINVLKNKLLRVKGSYSM